MRKVADFLKTTFLGGVVAIVPLSAVAFVLWSILSVMIEVVSAMEGVLPFRPAINTLIVGLAALVALIALCFLAGMALRTALGNVIKDRIDVLLERFIPLYGAAKKITNRVAGVSGSEFSPVEVDLHGTGAMVLGFVVEHLPEDRAAVFVPLTPAPSFGQVYLLPRSRLVAIDAPVAEVIGPITEWGAGAKRLFREGP